MTPAVILTPAKLLELQGKTRVPPKEASKVNIACQKAFPKSPGWVRHKYYP